MPPVEGRRQLRYDLGSQGLPGVVEVVRVRPFVAAERIVQVVGDPSQLAKMAFNLGPYDSPLVGDELRGGTCGKRFPVTAPFRMPAVVTFRRSGGP